MEAVAPQTSPMRYPLQYLPGVISDDTVLARAGRYTDADKVRWVRDLPELIGGWERVFRTAIQGRCRNSFAWIDNAGSLCLAFGTHSQLYVWRGGALYDITPTLARPSFILGAAPLAVTSGSAVVTVTSLDINGDPMAHGLVTGESVTLSGATAVGGITPNGTFAITKTGEHTFTFVFSGPASSTATGGGTAVVLAPQKPFAPGQINGTGGRGYGTGAYGVGGYGQPSEAEYYPRTWSFGTLGQDLVASPRGGTVYLWSGDGAERAKPIDNAPAQITSVMVTPERFILALGCSQEVSGVFDPRCVRHNDYRDETRWKTTDNGGDTLAREKILEGAGRIVSGRVAGYGAFVFTDNEVFDCRYAGSTVELYSFTKLGEDCGLIGPNAVAIKNQRAVWLTLDLQVMTVALGGEPATIENPMRDELEANLAPVQRDKIVLSTVAAFNEVWIFYPDNRDGLENSRAQFFSLKDGWWSKAKLARTAFIDAGPASYPLGVDPDGRVFWHERGQSADGDAIAWSLEAGPRYVDETERMIFFDEVIPDFKNQQGAITLTLITREEPQSPPVEFEPEILDPGATKMDARGEGRIVSFRLSGQSAPASFRMGTLIFKGTTSGER